MPSGKSRQKTKRRRRGPGERLSGRQRFAGRHHEPGEAERREATVADATVFGVASEKLTKVEHLVLLSGHHGSPIPARDAPLIVGPDG